MTDPLRERAEALQRRMDALRDNKPLGNDEYWLVAFDGIAFIRELLALVPNTTPAESARPNTAERVELGASGVGAAQQGEVAPLRPTFARELESLINRYSKENGSNTPDWVLADYLLACLAAFDAATLAREDYYGRNTTPSESRSRGGSAQDRASRPDASCAICGQAMRPNVPRLGPDGGWVHAETGRFECAAVAAQAAQGGEAQTLWLIERKVNGQFTGEWFGYIFKRGVYAINWTREPSPSFGFHTAALAHLAAPLLVRAACQCDDDYGLTEHEFVAPAQGGTKQ